MYHCRKNYLEEKKRYNMNSILPFMQTNLRMCIWCMYNNVVQGNSWRQFSGGTTWHWALPPSPWGQRAERAEAGQRSCLKDHSSLNIFSCFLFALRRPIQKLRLKTQARCNGKQISVSSKLAWSTQRGPGQPVLESSFQKRKTRSHSLTLSVLPMQQWQEGVPLVAQVTGSSKDSDDNWGTKRQSQWEWSSHALRLTGTPFYAELALLGREEHQLRPSNAFRHPPPSTSPVGTAAGKEDLCFFQVHLFPLPGS